MHYIASFDIGTTQTKGILVSSDAHPHMDKNINMVTDFLDNHMEQNPDQWFHAVQTILSSWFQEGINPEDIKLLTFSGQMQDCIPIDTNGYPVRPAILYGDSRAGKEAGFLDEQFPIQAVTGNHMDGTLTFPKILWLKQNESNVYQNTDSFLISSKDYVIRHLTGVCVTDPTTAATTGMMNIHSCEWQTDWLTTCEIDSDKLPVIHASDEIVGYVTKQASIETGLLAGTPVLCGIGDGGSASLGAGVFEVGQLYGYIGTTGWIATPVQQISRATKGLFHLPYIGGNKFLAIAPLMNAGNVHKWAVSTFTNTFSSLDENYESLENLVRKSDRANNSLLFLPYLNGERFPVQDPVASGSLIGIRPHTTVADMSCAALEGVAMAMRQVMEMISDSNIGELSLIGGGSKSSIWNQIMADVLNKVVKVPSESQFFPAMGAVMLGVKEMGWASSFDKFVLRANSVFPATTFTPDKNMVQHYEEKYSKFKSLYHSLQDIF